MADQVILGDGVVAGHGRVDGRVVYAFAQDFTVFGGSLSETNAAKIVKIMDLALKMGAPVVGLNDSGGARIQEGVLSLGGYADIFLRNTLASGDPADLRDHGALRRRRGLLAGDHRLQHHGGGHELHVRDRSDVIKTVTHEEVTKEELGGAMTHNATSGVAHFAPDDRECLRLVRELLGYLPSNNVDDPPRRETADPIDREDEALDRLVPESPNQPYDMLDLIHASWTMGSFSRCTALRTQHRGGIRAAGRPQRRHRRQPARLSGRHAGHRRLGEGRTLRALLRCLQHPARHLRRRARLPAHQAGIRRHHPPRRQAAVRLCRGHGPEGHGHHRKAYGGAYCVMSSKHIRTDVNFAWPTAEIAVMGPEGG